MKKLFIRGIALALCALMMLSLVSCAELFQSPGGSDSTQTDSTNGEKDPNASVSYTRRSGVYTVLMLGEGVGEGTLTSLFAVSFDMVGENGVSFLQIPVKTYINNADKSIENHYRVLYNAAIADGDTEDRAKIRAIEGVRAVVVEKFGIAVDYYLSATSEQLGNIVEKLGGVEINIPYVIRLSGGETLAQGKQTLNGAQVSALTRYSGFSEDVMMNFYKSVIAAIFIKAKASLGNDIVALFVHEVRQNVTTDIPSDRGEDIFFMKKFISQKSASVRFTQLATQSCAVSIGLVQVIHKPRAAESINGFLRIYTEEIEKDAFDKEGFFNDSTNQAVSTIYQSTGNAKTIYTAESIANGALPLT